MQPRVPGAGSRLGPHPARDTPVRHDGVRVAIDAMGGDHAPEATVGGAVLAARELGVAVALVGHADVVRGQLAEFDVEDLSISVEHAPDVIRMDEPPVSAVRRKPRSSLRASFELLRTGRVDAVVSAGNSGAVMAAGLFSVGGLSGVDRPAIAVPIPVAHGHVVLLDAGASVEASARDLVQYALMGQVYARVLSGIAAPRVALLSNGQEDSKGTEATRAASAELRQLPIGFVGYVEGRDICRGSVDVVVCDGFVGNAVLKALEGFGGMTLELLRAAFLRSWQGRIGYWLARRALAEVRDRLDDAEHGGAPLLGLDGVAIVAHGNASARAIRSAVRVAHDSVRLEMNRQIAEALASLSPISESGPRRGRLWRQLRGRFTAGRDGGDSSGGEPTTSNAVGQPEEG